MKNIIVTFAASLFFPLSCKYQDNEIGRPENYTLTERNISNDCNVYQMLFKDGNYILHFSLAGSCKDLNAEDYVKEYSNYLEKSSSGLTKRRGYIIFDKRESNEYDHRLQDTILAISKDYFKTNVTISESDSDTFTIKVFD